MVMQIQNIINNTLKDAEFGNLILINDQVVK